MRAVGVDFHVPALRRCHERELLAAAAEAAALPFCSGLFDLVVAQDLVEHTPDDRLTVGEMHRVCAPGGLVLLIVPTFQALWSTRDVRFGHFRRYTLGQIVGLLRSAGFQIVQRSYLDLFLLPWLWTAVKLAPRGWDDVPDLSVDTPGASGLLKHALRLVSEAESACVRWARLPIGVAALVVGRKL
jgi:ubiquinone/menaquinone biosynthesis C-methylase UbiE